MNAEDTTVAEDTAPVQILFTREITWSGVQVDVEHGPDDARMLVIIDPGTGTVYKLPMLTDLAQRTAEKLLPAPPIDLDALQKAVETIAPTYAAIDELLTSFGLPGLRAKSKKALRERLDSLAVEQARELERYVRPNGAGA